MPTGIYITSLRKSTTKESVEKYAARYIKELEYSTSIYNLFSFLSLKHISMHQSYWDDYKSEQSCTRLIFNKMKELKYFSITT